MENASKALLIAGAILIVILLIAIGMLVYSKSRETIDTSVAQMNSAEIQMFNAQFLNYEGKQDSIAVRELCYAILNNNIANSEDKNRAIQVNGSWKYSDGNTGRANEKTYPLHTIEAIIKQGIFISIRQLPSKTWNISFEYNDLGLIHVIVFNQNN